MKIKIDDIQKVIIHHARLALTGIPRKYEIDFGPPVFLWTLKRTGEEIWDVLPELLAQLRLEAIPEMEPDVARAKISLKFPDVDLDVAKRLVGEMIKMRYQEGGM